MNVLNIFLVINNHLMLQHYRQQLAMQGFKNISIFENESGCMARLNEHPDIVLLDMANSSKLLLALNGIKQFNPAIQVILLPDANYAGALKKSTKNASYILDYLVSMLSQLATR